MLVGGAKQSSRNLMGRKRREIEKRVGGMMGEHQSARIQEQKLEQSCSCVSRFGCSCFILRFCAVCEARPLLSQNFLIFAPNFNKFDAGAVANRKSNTVQVGCRATAVVDALASCRRAAMRAVNVNLRESNQNECSIVSWKLFLCSGTQKVDPGHRGGLTME